MRQTKTMIREAGIMKHIQMSRNSVRCPELLYDGTGYGNAQKFLVMTLLGFNLSQNLIIL